MDVRGGTSRARPLLLSLAALGLGVAVIVVLVSRGDTSTTDPEGDVDHIQGKRPRRGDGEVAASIADITAAEVRASDGEVVFSATLAAPPSRALERSSLEVRFDVVEQGAPSWIVVATINVAPSAAVVSQTNDYTATTIDGSLPGSVEVNGSTVAVAVTPSEIAGFPRSFEWSLATELIAFRDIPGSARVTDRFPAEGTVSF